MTVPSQQQQHRLLSTLVLSVLLVQHVPVLQWVLTQYSVQQELYRCHTQVLTLVFLTLLLTHTSTVWYQAMQFRDLQWPLW